MSDVEEVNIFAIAEFGDHLVDLGEFTALGVEVFATRKDAEQEDLGVWQTFAEFGDDGGDSVGDLSRGIVFAIGVIGADHDHCGLWFSRIEWRVDQTPEHMLGAIAADAEVDGLMFGEGLGPDLFGPIAFPALGDGIADE